MFGLKPTPRPKPPEPEPESESSVSRQPSNSEKQYLSGLRLWGLFLGTSLTASLIVLYVMIIATVCSDAGARILLTADN
jgi:hypothetical protein